MNKQTIVMETEILKIFDNIDQEQLIFYVLTLFGSVFMYAFSMHKGFNGTVEFLKKILPNKTNEFYIRVDFVIVSISGSIIGSIFFSPSTPLAALAAGFGWIGALNILTNTKKP